MGTNLQQPESNAISIIIATPEILTTIRQTMEVELLNAVMNNRGDKLMEILTNEQHQSQAPPESQAVPHQAPAPRTSRLLQGVTSDGDGVLHIVARFEFVDIVNKILESWMDVVDVTMKNKRGETPLHCAAATGNGHVIDKLISLAGEDEEKIKQLLRMEKYNGETCLHDAVRSGNLYAVKKLVNADITAVLISNDGHALVKICDNEGVSPLYLATTLRQLEIVKYLSGERGEKYPAASYDGPGRKTALHAAVLLDKDLSEHLSRWNNKEIIDKADESGSTPLHLLASTKDKMIMKLLLDLGSNAGYHTDNEGSLPIHVAAANGSLEIVKLLSGLCPSCAWSCNNQGQTILHIAVQNGEGNVVKYVCSGKKFERIINARDIDGNTALHLAVLEADQSIFCRLMRRKEVCLSITNKEERTPLDLAVLSIPPDIFFAKTPRHWIMYSLLVAGADYGIYRSDQFPCVNVAKFDEEKETKSISKSAGVLAVCALLILTTAFAEPLAVTKFYDKTEKNVARRFAYRIFAYSDAMAFALSVLSIACCTRAGFSFTTRRKQLFYLMAGLGFLFAAAIFIILVFTGGLYLAVGSVVDKWTLAGACLPGVLYPLMILILLAPVSSALPHTLALLSRLGRSGWSSALICLLPSESRDRTDATIRFRRLCVKCIFTVFFATGAFVGVFWPALLSIKRD